MNLVLLVLSLIPAVGDSLLDFGRLTGREADRVGRIVIVGNTITHQDVIVRELRVAPGQVLSYAALKRAEIRLLRLGIFDFETPPRVAVQPGPETSVYKDILVTVKEVPTGIISVGAGVRGNLRK